MPIVATLVWTALLTPLLCAAGALARPRPRWVLVADVVASVAILGAGAGLLAVTTRPGAAAVVTAGGFLRADPLTAYLLVVVGAVAVTASWGGLGRRRAASARGARYTALVCLFLAAMVLAVVADDLGVTWVAVEATTIATAFLVGHAGGRRAIEAAWKYVVLASVGVGVAFLGLVLLYAATRAAGDPTLSWVHLVTTPPAVDPTVTRMGLALAALGFATKAGLAPMHSWLPDAHSQAPAPVSGLMSGVLLAVAFGAVLRIERLDGALLGGSTVRHLVLAAGLASLLVAAALVVTQQDYKRLLAYSSIEHMGVVAVAAGVGGPLALGAMLLHLLAHGLAKASSFVVAGRILAVEGTARIHEVRGLLRRSPRLAIPFLVGAAALLGLPPSALFVTEAALVVGGIQRGYGWLMAATLALLLVVFVGVGRNVLAMTLGAPDAATVDPGAPAPPRPPAAGATDALQAPMAPVVLALAATAVLAFVPATGILAAVVDVVAGAR
jgi:hydrogenase-4 component F